MTRKLIVRAKAMYHINDLGKTVRRGDLLELTPEEVEKSNDLWKGQQFGLLVLKWEGQPDVVVVPQPPVPIHAPAYHQPPVSPASPVTMPDVRDVVDQSLRPVRSQMADLGKKVEHLEQMVEDLTLSLADRSEGALGGQEDSEDPSGFEILAPVKTRKKRDM